MMYSQGVKTICDIKELTVEFVKRSDIVKIWVCTSDEEEEKLLSLLRGLDLVYGKPKQRKKSAFLKALLKHNKAVRINAPLTKELAEHILSEHG